MSLSLSLTAYVQHAHSHAHCVHVSHSLSQSLSQSLRARVAITLTIPACTSYTHSHTHSHNHCVYESHSLSHSLSQSLRVRVTLTLTLTLTITLTLTLTITACTCHTHSHNPCVHESQAVAAVGMVTWRLARRAATPFQIVQICGTAALVHGEAPLDPTAQTTAALSPTHQFQPRCNFLQVGDAVGLPHVTAYAFRRLHLSGRVLALLHALLTGPLMILNVSHHH